MTLQLDPTTTILQSPLVSEEKKYAIKSEILDKVKKLIASKTTYDPFGNCTIDLINVDEFADKMHARALKIVLPGIVESEKAQQKHLVILKISPKQVRLYKYVQQVNFVFHQAHYEFAIAIKCLRDKEHPLSQCGYPKYKTASVGVTGVVFNRELTRFLAIQESTGPYRGWKAPTGTVDYEKGEDPVKAVVREIAEETNVNISAENALLVGNSWTSCFRGTNPDINFAYAFCTDEDSQQLKAQESEIKKVEWISVKDFLENPAPVSHDKPLILKGVVEAALEAMRSRNGWIPQSLFWGSGKAVSFYSSKM